MYCNKCGAEIKDGNKFCAKCGNKLKMNLPENQTKTRSKMPIVILGGVIVLVVIASSFFIIGRESEANWVRKGINNMFKIESRHYLLNVENEEEKWGYINEKGEEVIKCQYDSAYSFGENGLAAVKKQVGFYEDGEPEYKWGYINEKGEEVIELQYSYVQNFSENGLAAVEKQVGVDDKGKPEYKWGYINEKGEEIIECQYEVARTFGDNGLAVVCKEGDAFKGRWICINEVGEEIIDLGWRYYSVYEFSDTGMAVVIKKDESTFYKYGEAWGYINDKGEEVINCQYGFTSFGFANNGLAVTIKKIGEDEYKWGYINEKGEEVIKYQYDEAYTFSNNGLAAVKKQVGIDENGKPEFKWGYINEKGEEVISCQYDDANRFNDNGFATVKNQNQWYIINEKNEIELVIPDKYCNVMDDVYYNYEL